jgi:hypothetical protein
MGGGGSMTTFFYIFRSVVLGMGDGSMTTLSIGLLSSDNNTENLIIASSSVTEKRSRTRTKMIRLRNNYSTIKDVSKQNNIGNSFDFLQIAHETIEKFDASCSEKNWFFSFFKFIL